MTETFLSQMKYRRARGGFALVLVLFFVLLLVGLILTYLSRSMVARQVSTSSLGETKASLLARSAGNVIIGDLKQEITDGSILSTPAPGVTIYTPKATEAGAPSTAVPALAGFTPVFDATTKLETDGLNNLLKRSASGVPFYSSAVNPNYAAIGTARAANVNSTTNPSFDGRFISRARWNSHYLLTRDSGAGSSDSTPVSAFPAPDWIFMARDGTNPTTWSNPLADSTLTNTQAVVGRYAYAIYNEGGLLNMNAAGFPATGLTPLQVASNKNVSALADLSQLPGGLTPSQINNLIGWRNYASAGLTSTTGSFGSVSFGAASANTWLKNFVTNPATGFYNTNGFMTVIPPPTGSTGSDQAFLSRQQLIGLTESLHTSPDVLPCLGTFSRALEQPSFTPDPNRPRIINAGTPPPAATLVDNYVGNNDGQGGDDVINPPFLSVRVITAFTHWNGDPAVVGEPLVKTKFALSRLGFLTYNATNNTVASAVGTSSDADPIYDRFGLKRNSASGPWTYDHGGVEKILTLSQVAAAGRDPDFAELLKAAITVGSLAKGGPNLHNDQGNYQFTLDTSVDYNVLQIMANLIDQYDTDSYPTVIQIASGSIMRSFRGIEDLPYFYRYHPFSVVTALPSPMLGSGDNVNFKDGTGTADANGNYPGSIVPYSKPATGIGTVTGGNAVLLYVPEVWNPHDPNTVATTSAGPRPSQFEIVAVTDDPAQQTPAWSTGAKCSFANGNYPRSADIPYGTQTKLTESNTGMTFTDHNGALFREPTMLWRVNAPANANLQLAAGNLLQTTLGTSFVKDINTSQQYVGIFVGQTPINTVSNIATTAVPQDPNNQYLFQSSDITVNPLTPPGSFAQITFRLKYRDASGNWVTYDEKYPDLHGLASPTLVINKNDFPNDAYMNPTPVRTNQLVDSATSMDPRTPRFGVGTSSTLGQSSPGNPGLEPALVASWSDYSKAGNDAVGNSNFTILETDRPNANLGDYVRYSNPGMTSDPGKNKAMRWFSGTGFSASGGALDQDSPLEYDGLFSQNNPAMNLTAKDNATSVHLYYEDADGIARRAMGAYADTTFTSPVGMPMATANTYAGNNGVGTATAQSQSRSFILNRAFRSVSEMSYAFRGTPWKNLDFFTPESGDAALLDVFCLNEGPANALVAGKVDLNTRQAPVLQALIAGASRDELSNLGSPPAYALPGLTTAESANVAAKLVGITTDTTTGWRGPLNNVSGLVGRFVATPGPTGTATDQYTYAEPITSKSYTYAGLSAALDSSVYTASDSIAPKIQRFREAALRPLADSGQTRVWNLLVDIVAQTGRYPKNATALNQFLVEGESRVWLHLAIDRMTGQVIDQQVEVVTQ